jgi:diaminopimelate epimerase
MEIEFYKYQGTGNDFIMINGLNQTVNFSLKKILKICQRRFGVGADGLIILKSHPDLDFEMDYYNADGSQSFCGNGSRCAQAFAEQIGLIKDQSKFLAIDGVHQGKKMEDWFGTLMNEVSEVQRKGADFFVHTGSPHYIKYVEDVDEVDVFTEGRKIRNQAEYKAEGTNVNFVSIEKDRLKVRTYERGVEDETFSCGTGVTAAAISYLVKEDLFTKSVKIETKGGELRIDLERTDEHTFKNIWLVGPATFVFKGEFSF